MCLFTITIHGSAFKSIQTCKHNYVKIIFNKLMFYQMGSVIDPKMRNLQEIIGFLVKIQLYLNLYGLKMTV